MKIVLTAEVHHDDGHVCRGEIAAEFDADSAEPGIHPTLALAYFAAETGNDFLSRIGALVFHHEPEIDEAATASVAATIMRSGHGPVQ